MRIRKSAKDRKRDIEQTALTLAFRVGPNQVTTGMIADELGLTQPAIYRHYQRKDDIWAAIAQHLSRQITQNVINANDARLTPDARLKMLVLGHLQLVRKNPALPEFMVIRDTKDGHVIVHDTIQDAITVFRAAIVDNVTDAIKSGIFCANIDAEDAATLIFGVIQSLALRMMVTRDPGILAKDGERLLDLLMAGFTQTGENK